MMKLIPRTAQQTLEILAKEYPSVVITGPRQSGKTTLSRMAFPEQPYVSLEELDNRDFAQQDPRGFLSQYPHGAILDEIQRCPDLFSYLQARLDESNKMGQFILTGSQQFGLLSSISQSLAGRVARISLLPFSLQELQAVKRAPGKLAELLFNGMYPPIYDRKLNPRIWYDNYVSTYLERDVRQLINVRDLSTFQRFIRMCAARTGQILNLSMMAGDCGITHNTAKAWISVLEASYIVHLLRPHHKNFNKRLIKSPKLYFYDSGLAAWLLNIQNPGQLEIHPARGHLFETWVVSEVLKLKLNKAQRPDAYFWRDSSGNEIDLLLEDRGKLIPIEIKSGETIVSEFFRAIDKFVAIANGEATHPVLIYGGDRVQKRSGVDVIPWKRISTLMDD